MKIHRKSGIARGKGEETMVFYSWHGRQVGHRLARPYTRENTTQWLKSKSLFGELSALWRELPDSIRALWDHYAASQGNASEMEKSEAVTHRYCPIPNYPPRPKLLSGHNAFIGANAKASAAGLSAPRIYPPLYVAPPPAPGLDTRYDRESGELAVTLDVPKGRNFDQRKALLWIIVGSKGRYIVRRLLLDSINLPAGQQKFELRYEGLGGYAPIKFSKLDYLWICLGAQVLETSNKDTAPIISAGAIKAYYILNDRRYLPLEDLIQSRIIKNVGRIRFSRDFYSHLRRRMAKIGSAKSVLVMPDKMRSRRGDIK